MSVGLGDTEAREEPLSHCLSVGLGDTEAREEPLSLKYLAKVLEERVEVKVQFSV